MTNQLVNEAAQYVRQMISVNPMPNLYYHNLNHTEYVVRQVVTICKSLDYNELNTNLLKVAAWFHDIGYYAEVRKNHEQKSADIATEFLESKGVDFSAIQEVRDCILATEMPQHPKTMSQKILCDADLSHFADPQFLELSKLLKKEFASCTHKKIPKEEWWQNTFDLLNQHKFYTDYGQKILEAGKQKSLQILREKLNDVNVSDTEMLKDLVPIKPKSKGEKPSKGIETMFRITSGNNQKLSQMADNKAHILISVNSIILSAIISILLRKLDEYVYLSIPTYIILSVSVLSMIFSLLATIPNLPTGRFSPKDVDEKKVNLLFFGNFYKMTLQEYTKGMLAMMDDYQYLYRSLIKDVYSQGVVLSRKYKLLRISYTIFMFGIIVSVFAFIIASQFFKP